MSAQDSEALTRAIYELESGSALRDRLCKAAHARVESQLSITATAALTGGLYRDLVRDSSVRA